MLLDERGVEDTPTKRKRFMLNSVAEEDEKGLPRGKSQAEPLSTSIGRLLIISSHLKVGTGRTGSYVEFKHAMSPIFEKTTL